MSEKKKMSTADILAAARKGSAGDAPVSAVKAAAKDPPVVESPSAGEAPSEAPSNPPAAKPKPAATGGKMSVADILAAARAGKAAAASESAAKPAAAAATQAVEKPAVKPKVDKPAAKAVAPVASGAVRDTSSILAAARASAKPGPVTKSEAAARLKPSAPATAAKGEQAAVPPMPPKPDYAKPKPTKVPAGDKEERRFFLSVLVGSFLGVGFTTMAATGGLWTLATLRFMFPNVLTEPPSKFKIGFPSDFPLGVVDEKFKAQFGIWPVNVEYKGQSQIVALKTVCTHLGCTPNWLEAEQKFKCPCHGSGFYKDGVNFEGPAPRPLERYAIRLADDGQLEVDKSRTFQEELGQWSDPGCFVAV